MRIERLAAGESDRLRRLRLRALADAPQAFSASYAETAARPNESWREQVRTLPTFVAVAAHGDVGMVRVTIDPARPGEARLLSMWVAPEMRGRGAGEALSGAVTEWVRGQG